MTQSSTQQGLFTNPTSYPFRHCWRMTFSLYTFLGSPTTKPKNIFSIYFNVRVWHLFSTISTALCLDRVQFFHLICFTYFLTLYHFRKFKKSHDIDMDQKETKQYFEQVFSLKMHLFLGKLSDPYILCYQTWFKPSSFARTQTHLRKK